MLQRTHSEKNVGFGDVIGELENGTPKGEHNGGGVLMEELCGDEVSLDDSDKDDIFINFFFLQAPRSCAPKSNVENPSLIFLDSKSTVCTVSNANLVENIHPHEEGKSVCIHMNGGT